jgi:U3 small nucleolar RNA-associated protein 18
MAPKMELDQDNQLIAESDEDIYESLDERQDELARQIHGVGEKDSEEEDLERMVLGNRTAFREELSKDTFLFDGVEPEKELRLEKIQGREAADLEDVEDSALFFVDAGDGLDKPDLAVALDAGDSARDEDAPAWEDSDDERRTVSLASATRLRKLRISEADDVVSGAEYTRRLRQQYLRLNPLPDWAKSRAVKSMRRRRPSASSRSSDSSSQEIMSDEEEDPSTLPLAKFLRSTAALAEVNGAKRRRLRPEVLDIQRTRDIPDTHRGPVGSLAFHPQRPILLSSSTASILYLHHIAPTAHPTPNPALTSVQLKGTPIRRSEFLHPDGDEIVMAGRRKYFHIWTLSSGLVRKVTKIQGHRLEQKTTERFRLSPCGRYMALIATDRKGGGMLNIVNVKSLHWLAQARIDSRGGIADFAWWSDGEGVTILGRDGQVAEWSMASRRTLGVWRDEGSTGGTVIAMAGSGGPTALGGTRWAALGSSSGVLNLYDRNGLISEKKNDEVTLKPLPTPVKAFEQLITPITAVTFSPDGQIMAFASQHKKDALRLVHVGTASVYRNWPTEQTPLGRITATAFGSESDILAVGNDMGKIRLWEIRS